MRRFLACAAQSAAAERIHPACRGKDAPLHKIGYLDVSVHLFSAGGSPGSGISSHPRPDSNTPCFWGYYSGASLI